MARATNGACVLGCGLVAMAGLCTVGCLPADTRPEPARIYMGTEPSPNVLDGHVSDDGWSIRYERFVTALGDVRLTNEECNDYSGTRYEWLFDFTELGEPHKVGLAYGIGKCSVTYRMRDASNDTVTGPGTTEDDVLFMRIEGTDEYNEGQETALWLIGEATKDDVTKRFEWLFRSSYTLTKCQQVDDENARHISNMELEGGDEHDFSITIRPQELFRERADGDAAVRFEPFAAADADGDGWVTLEELDEVPANPEGLTDEDYEHLEDFDGLDEDASLRDYVDQVLLPKVSRLAGGGVCQARQRRRR